jgi:hypothetical protein
MGLSIIRGCGEESKAGNTLRNSCKFLSQVSKAVFFTLCVCDGKFHVLASLGHMVPKYEVKHYLWVYL